MTTTETTACPTVDDSPAEPPQELLLRLLLRGASPIAACTQIGIPVSRFLTWLESPAFQRRLTESRNLLSQNVAAALYRAAMEGSVTAQTFFLKHVPPPDWPQGRPADGPSSSLLQLSDDELIDFCRTHGIDPALSDLDPDRPPLDAP